MTPSPSSHPPGRPLRAPHGFAAAAAAALTLAGTGTATPVRAIDTDAMQVARQLNRAFVEVTEAISPSVVVITVTQKPDADELEELRQYRRMLRPEDDTPEVDPEPVEGQGSGVIIRPEGYIVTNFHVVSGAEQIKVRLHDGREFQAVVRGTHREADLAVLRLQGLATNLPAARFADSEKVRVGEFAIAVGAPYELDYSVTFGHVSAKGRGNLFGGPLEQDFIQTDASINLGNSGGPLVNLDGEVIGINSMIRAVGTGIGFAIPANQVRLISDRIIAEGTFHRSWLGISMPRPFELQRLKKEQPMATRGVRVQAISPEGPASRSKLQVGDVIVAVDGKTVRSPGQLVAEVALKTPGRDVQLDVLREEKTVRVAVQTEPMPEALLAARSGRSPHPVEGNPHLNPDGAKLMKLTPALAKEFSIKGQTAGVLVTDVTEKSPSDDAGLARGDLILSVNGKAVATPREYRQALKSSKANRTRVGVFREGSQVVVFFENRSE